MTEDSALALACVSAGASRLRTGAALKFFWGPMDCGKSTLALQMDHNHARQGRHGIVLTRNDRSRQPTITTRIGLARQAIEVHDDMNLINLVRGRWADGHRVDYVICDEACFYTVEQIDQLADLVDAYDVDVYAFGLASDFRAQLFPAAQRLFELADEVARLQVEVLCWCGREGLLNARIVDGVVVREGAQVVIGDTADSQHPADAQHPTDAQHPAGAHDPDGGHSADTHHSDIRYQVLCRRHHRAGHIGPTR